MKKKFEIRILPQDDFIEVSFLVEKLRSLANDIEQIASQNGIEILRTKAGQELVIGIPDETEQFVDIASISADSFEEFINLLYEMEDYEYERSKQK